MLALVEPCIISDIPDRPHLGCAMLIAACRQKGQKVTLIKGQTRYLKDMFVNDSEELWGLIRDMKTNNRLIQKKGLKQFQDELKSLYRYVITDKDPRHYFDASKVEEFRVLHAFFIRVYSYYLCELNHPKLRIIDRYVSEIIRSRPRYIGFSVQDAFDPLSRVVRRRIKELTGIPIIAGGSFTPFIDLKKLARVFEEEYFDYLVIGAGEHALPALIGALANKKEPKGIKNVFYRKNGLVKGNGLEAVNDLDKLAYPDYSQFDLDLYPVPVRILPLQTARGCTWRKCAFCSNHNIDLGHYKTFSVERVIETIKYLRKTYSCTHFALNDLEVAPERAKLISEAILNNDLHDINIMTQARLAGGFNNSATLSLMRKAGFSLIQWGLESGSQRVLDLMHKGITVKNASQVLKKSSKNGISNICFVIFGFPGEKKAEARQTETFLEKHARYIDGIHCSGFTMARYSPIWKNPRKWNAEKRNDGSFFYINKAKFTSGRLPDAPMGLRKIIIFFLLSSHQHLTAGQALEYLKKRRLDSIFPVIPGELDKGIAFDNIEEKIFLLADGKLSADGIILVISKRLKSRYGKEYIAEKCADFLRRIFSRNQGLCFAKSWC